MAVKITGYKTPIEAIKVAAKRLVSDIKSAKRPLLMLSGGSSLNVARSALKDLSKKHLNKLTVGQIDARFVPLGDPDSNWTQIENLPLPINDLRGAVRMLSLGESPNEIAANYSARLEEMMSDADKVFGLYGVSSDGHIAGILPQRDPEDFTKFVDGRLVVAYKARDFHRITTTDSVIARLDRAIVFAAGQEKIDAINRLEQELPPRTHPAQLLKDAKSTLVYYSMASL